MRSYKLTDFLGRHLATAPLSVAKPEILRCKPLPPRSTEGLSVGLISLEDLSVAPPPPPCEGLGGFAFSLSLHRWTTRANLNPCLAHVRSISSVPAPTSTSSAVPRASGPGLDGVYPRALFPMPSYHEMGLYIDFPAISYACWNSHVLERSTARTKVFPPSRRGTKNSEARRSLSQP